MIINYEREDGSKGTKLITGEGLTRQDMKNECDINVIMNKYVKHGKLPDMIKKNPQYGDFSAATDYKQSLDIVLDAQEQFNNLSAAQRKQFANDPAKFLEFANSEENAQAMEDMQLNKPVEKGEENDEKQNNNEIEPD